MGYYENTSLTNIDDLMTFFANSLVSESWVRTTLDNDSGPPSSNSRFSRTEMFVAPGTVDQEAACVAIMARGLSSVGSHRYRFTTATGLKGGAPIPISTVSQVGTTLTITTVNPHGLSTGDCPCIVGTDNSDLNFGHTGGTEVAVSTLTVTGLDTFTVTCTINQTASGSGGYVLVLINPTAALLGNYTYGLGSVLDDADCDCYMYADSFRAMGLVQQGGDNKPWYVGQTGRDHVQSEGSSVGSSSDAITGTGSQTITLKRVPDNMYNGQPLWVISKTTYDAEYTTITNISGDQLTATFNTAFAGDSYIVGWDPAPHCVVGISSTGVDQVDFGSMIVRMGLTLDITNLPRNGVAQNNCDDTNLEWDIEIPVSTADYSSTNPDAQGYYQGSEVIFEKGGEGVRKYLYGATGWPKGVQNEHDIQDTGPSGGVNDFIVFISISVDNNFFLGIGPGKT